jgi:very-short-patch-repair endonuclease
MRVFSSIKGSDINPAAAASNGARLLKDFLTYAEHKNLDSHPISALSDTDPTFEREVLQELERRGIKIVPQIGVCEYRIDLGVLDDGSPGKFICGIECDGVAYHDSQTARDRDRLRQQVLEGRGWEIHRVWSTDWFKDRAGQIDRLLGLIEQSRKNAQKEFQEEKTRIDLEKARAEQDLQNILVDISDSELTGLFNNLENKVYVRPVAVPYQFANDDPVFSHQYLLNAPMTNVARALLAVVDVEAPLHIKDLTARVAAMWGQKSGSNISYRIREVAVALHEHKRLEMRGDFIWKPGGEFTIRSRRETNITTERIAPEEIREVLLQILRAAAGFTRQALVNEVRAVFGFSRTGSGLQQTIDSIIENMLAEGLIGEGSLGIALRN